MSTKQEIVLSELRALATQRDWMPVVTLVDDLLAYQEKQIVVAAPARVDTSAFQRWIAQCEPGKTVISLPLEGLAQEPLPSIKAEHLLAVFECGVLLGTDEADAIVRAFFSRPPGSYAIVLSGSERLTEEEELDVIQRGVWRLLVPEPKPDWNQQDLLEHGCYLWSDAEPGNFLRARLQRDQMALASWLHQPLACAEEFRQLQVLRVLDLAEEQANQSDSPAQDSTDLSSHQLMRTRETLTTLRRRLIRRLDDNIESLERQLATSLQSLEQDLLYGLRPYLQKQLPQSTSETSVDQLKTVITTYITSGAEPWGNRAEQLWGTLCEEIASEAESLLHSADWSLINTVAAKKGSGQVYPDALLQNLRMNSNLGTHVTDEFEQMPPATLSSTSSSSSNIRTVLVGALTGSGVLAAATIFLGFGPVQLVAAGAAAMLGGMLTKGHLERGQLINLAEMYGRSTITAVIREAIADIQARIRQSHMSIRNHLINELRALETVLDEAFRETQHPVEAASEADTDRQTLETYRRKVVAVEHS